MLKVAIEFLNNEISETEIVNTLTPKNKVLVKLTVAVPEKLSRNGEN